MIDSFSGFHSEGHDNALFEYASLKISALSAATKDAYVAVFELGYSTKEDLKKTQVYTTFIPIGLKYVHLWFHNLTASVLLSTGAAVGESTCI